MEASFAAIGSRTELASKLKCDTHALEYVQFVSPQTSCKKPECKFPAAECNHGYFIC